MEASSARYRFAGIGNVLPLPWAGRVSDVPMIEVNNEHSRCSARAALLAEARLIRLPLADRPIADRIIRVATCAPRNLPSSAKLAR